MIPFDAKMRFNALFKNQYFIRVDSSHPLELYLGVDKNGKKALRFIGKFSASKIAGTKAIMVKTFPLGENNCIQFSLLDEDATDPFYKFVDDLVDASRKLTNSEDGYKFVFSRYNRWKKMFTPSRETLSEAEVMGLLGELNFLSSYLLPKYGEEAAVRSWSASDPTLKDFSIDKTWFELKTTGPKSSTIHINSLEQLESECPGNLVIVRLEKMSSAFAGINLNTMVESTMDKIVSPEVLDEFQNKLLQRGYALNERYDELVYEIKSMTRYCIEDDFPKLTVSNMEGAVVDAEYDLLIEKLKKYIADFN